MSRIAGKRWVWIVAFIAACVGVGGYYLWSSHEKDEVVRAAIPPHPDFGTAPEAFARAIESAERRVTTGSDKLAALAELGMVYQANGYLAEAGRCYEGLRSLGYPKPKWAYRYAIILSSFGETDTAANLLREVINLAADYEPASIKLGQMLLKSGAIDEAATVYDAALQVHPGEPYALLGLARCEVERKNWQKARTLLERVVNVTDYALGYDVIVTVYEHLGMQERADAILGPMKARGAFRDIPDPWMDELLTYCFDPYQLLLAAGTAKRNSDRDRGIELLRRAVELDPDTAQLRFQLALELIESKQYTAAREHLQACVKLAPEFADGWAHLSSLYLTIGDSARSNAVLEQGLRACPNSPGLHMMRAQRRNAAGEHEAAIADLEVAIRERPTEADPFIMLGMIYIQQGRGAEGARQLERSLIAEPENPVALSLLAFQAIASGDEKLARKLMGRIQRQPRVAASERETLEKQFHQAFGHEP